MGLCDGDGYFQLNDSIDGPLLQAESGHGFPDFDQNCGNLLLYGRHHLFLPVVHEHLQLLRIVPPAAAVPGHHADLPLLLVPAGQLLPPLSALLGL